MKIVGFLASVPEKVYVILFLVIFFVACLSLYFIAEDTRVLEQKIQSKQKELANVLALKELYNAKRQEAEKAGGGKKDRAAVSLAVVEEMVSKNFTTGKLSMLRPSSVKEDKGAQRTLVEVRVNAASMGEVLQFLRDVEVRNLKVRKLQLSVPAGQGLLDMHASITEGAGA